MNLVTKNFFLCLCHWKSPRNMRFINEHSIDSIRRVLTDSLGNLKAYENEEDIRKAINTLSSLKGIGVRTASAILAAWNPDRFGVYDFKVHELLKLPGKVEDATPDTYLGFLQALRDLAKELRLDCSLRQIELAVWHYFPIQDRGTYPKQKRGTVDME